ncbi:murein polymerase, putative, gt51D [Cellvibrio sp. BR]|uniref:penicillin-binding protein 1A n=1 Tax=Cellvibrio sp. BR TaxID=1134474 RepID=UPI000260093C|nr:penicillin-binding protein 1A [Cellvibrio sp. BR]EIK43497.1 murein polymerase, putative, gt51D [Cellvibrio sp. BR]
MPATHSDFANSLIHIEKMFSKKSLFGIIFWLLLAGTSVTLVTLTGLYLYLSPKLPSVETLREIKLQTPLRVYSSDGKLIGEFGEQRRTPLTYDQIPPLYIKALLSAEDAEFFEHHGVSLKGMLRAASQILKSGAIQSGGSTITQQLARDFFLTRKQVFSRKFNEILLSLEIERKFTKEEILELFNNKMFFGNRAYGLQSAAQIYYGKDVHQLSVAQYAMIVGVLKAPSAYNPLANLKRAMIRRDWIIGRMYELGHIDQHTYEAAINEPNTASYHGTTLDVQAPYISEMARQEVLDRFGDKAYSEGYRVYTSVDSAMQATAQAAVLKGLLGYDQRHGYRGPERRLKPSTETDLADWQDELQTIPSLGGQEPAAVLQVNEKAIRVLISNGEMVDIDWEQGLANIRPYITEDSRGPAYTKATDFLKTGDVVRITKNDDDQWQFSQVPAIQAALVSLDPMDGAIRSLVGGFDFNQSHYNRATQGMRQPGSSFKPLLYTAALENGFTPASIINDAPIVIENTSTGVAWRPENDDGKFVGPMRLRQALYRSRNLVSIRLLRSIGMQTALDSLARFGFNPKEFPRDLTLALGTHALTPMQMATAYATFANGGFKIDPYLVTRIEDDKGRVVYEARPKRVCKECEQTQVSYADDGSELPAMPSMDSSERAPRIIDARVAYLMDSILRDVVDKGTARLAKQLGRRDLAGKTGTTNGPRDTWFSGYNPNIATTVWVGFDQNTLLGKREFGSSAALPIWIDFMRTALEGVPDQLPRQPEGIVTVRINPDTGKPAMPGDPDAIFEVFLGEDTARTSAAGNEVSEQVTLPEELF